MTSGFLKRLLAMLAFVCGGVAAEALRPVSCNLLHVSSVGRSATPVRRSGGANHKV